VIAPLFQISVSRNGGKQATLAEYHDSVLLIVKASACGLAPR
jgi:glutathione peroxidase-family protein